MWNMTTTVRIIKVSVLVSTPGTPKNVSAGVAHLNTAFVTHITPADEHSAVVHLVGGDKLQVLVEKGGLDAVSEMVWPTSKK